MRTLTLFAQSLLVVALTACGPHPPHKPIIVKSERWVAAPQPTQIARDTFKGCTWERVVGAHLSIWSFHCGVGQGDVHLVADDRLGGFDIASNGSGSYNVIRTFTIPKGAGIAAALPAIRAASPGKDTTTCTLQPAPAFDAWGGKLYELAPTGAAKAAYDKANAVEPQAPPCGDLGIGPDGDRFFTVMTADPTRVLYVDMGSEIQIFDPNTIRGHE